MTTPFKVTHNGRHARPASPCPDTAKIGYPGMSTFIAQLGKVVVACAVVVGSAFAPMAVAEVTAAPTAVVASPPAPKRASLQQEPASAETLHIAHWVVDSGDNLGMPFVIVDKTGAKVFVFDAKGQLRGAAPALLGLARGDHSVPGIGERPLSSIKPEERTTPAGRFVASLDRNMRGDEILWVDYDSAISMHRVVTGNAKERRAQRLASPTVLDNRISYGCINIPVAFYDNVLRPAFTGTNGIVYVLPETRSAREQFSSYDVEERARTRMASLSTASPTASAAARH